jgi:aminoglycoside 6'-N-acetyltransferase
MLDQNLFNFRKLNMGDLEMLQKWLNEPSVHEWYGREYSNTLEDVTQRYEPRIHGAQPIQCFLFQYGSRPIGYIQMFNVHDWPKFEEIIGHGKETMCVDMYIGEKDYMGQGLGSKMLKIFLQQILFQVDGILTCIVCPDEKNTDGIRTYEQLGFRKYKSFPLPGDKYITVIMEINKDELK